MNSRQQKGFTLIELLIVIVIIGILAVVIFVAVDPAKRFADARNARRFSEVNSILEALLTYQIDQRGKLPNNGTGFNIIDSDALTSQIFGSGASGCDTGCAAAGTTLAACANLTPAAVAFIDQYLAEMPIDTEGGSSTKTLYYVNKTANGRLKVGSCAAENSVVISVQR
ncbi:MAG: Uncharacterized protein G01um101418_934 [Parcubacteria group bacterium Gr01-1014_18]|nr:MAG: Uncharacterized protein Greene041636_913 [Parcubacteria group bacterium Greene0416_36]TSC79770.1 MAG: Uncharacterized protein G01um101418_934 [Parcubacteria group bacterium Gr01-1014_18]TSC97972.1 MAG: Uncharacterized protein Greene101420_929 [Parcubacteria group bacterium Greene1014_20]TSD06601.1 MAG: Uncharacterized protein Greene07142_740 [Parcubacteria group bacterium Greene0714_2]